jgi:hypothetical protein
MKTQIEIAQYIIDEFLDHNKKVVEVNKLDAPISVEIVFEDGSYTTVNGLGAQRILEGEEKSHE